MKVFVLEDDPDRIRQLCEWLKGCEWDCVHTCMREGEFNPPYDLILLDHDLGGRQLIDHEDDGVSFVRLIKDRINPEADIIIHSYNLEGAKRMQAELKPLQSERVPFGPSLRNRIEGRKRKH